MNQKKNARAGTATPTRAVENGSVCETAQPSTKNDITSSPSRQAVHIADLLSHGPENGVTLRHLEKLTGADNRTIRRQIELERRAGTLIISDNRHGYYLTDDPAEVQRFTRSMSHRAREILRTVKAVEEAARLD